MRPTQHSPRLSSRIAVPLALLMIVTGMACQDLGDLDVTQADVAHLGSCGAVEQEVKTRAIADLSRVGIATERGEVYNPYAYTALPGGQTAGTERTHNQEAGVDEADLMQLDGDHAFVLHEQRLVIVETFGQRAADGGVLQTVEGARIVADVTLDGQPIEMFLDEGGRHLVVLTHLSEQDLTRIHGAVSTDASRAPSRLVQATVFDVSDRAQPKRIRRVAVEGQLLATRHIDGKVYLVSRAGLGGPQLQMPTAGQDMTAWAASQRAVIEQAGIDAWLPYAWSTSATSASGASQVDCGSVYTARTATGDDALTIYSFELTDPDSELHTTTFIGDGTLVYASTESLIVAHTNYATTRYDDGDTDNVQATTLHRFTFDDEADGAATYSASGLVHGWILDAFSISEYDGYLRVATQVNRGELQGYKPINVFTLSVEPVPVGQPVDGVLQDGDGEQQAPREYLMVTGELVDIEHGEDLYASRFVGDIAYVITWVEERGDPLFTIDLSNPVKPEVLGKLQIPGFSTYLHPIQDGRLIGVGRDTDEDAVKLSLFDVRNLRRPDALHEIPVGGSGADSEAVEEHRAFRYLPDQRLAVLPIDSSSGARMDVYRVTDDRLEEVARLEQDGARMRRAYAVGGHLYALSEAGLQIVSLGDLGVRATVRF